MSELSAHRKMKRIKNKSFYIFLLFTLICAVVYSGILFNQTMPYAEGWYTYYAECINKYGMVPYKDFEFLFSPVYIFFIAFITKIFGYKIIVLRILGIVMFSVIDLSVYLLICEIFSRKKAWIACVATILSILYLQSEIVQIYYDYVRFMDIFSILSTVYLLRACKRMIKEESYHKELIICGIFVSLFINIKQNMGLIYFAYVLVLLAFLTVIQKKSIKSVFKDWLYFLTPIIVIQIFLFLMLFMNGSLSSYLNLSGSGALSAKGGMFKVLTNWILNANGAFSKQFLKATIILVLIEIGLYIKKLSLKESLDENFDKQTKINYFIGIGYSLICILLFAGFTRSQNLTQKFTTDSYFSPYVIFNVVFSMFIVLGFYLLISKKEHTINSYLIFIASGSYFAISYGCGTSGGLAEGQATIGVALVAAVLLDLYGYIKIYFPRIVICILCASITLQSGARKLVNTYNWWGMTESNLWSSVNKTDIPLLDGILLSSETKDVYENIYHSILRYTSENDPIYCFPQIPIFYSLCNRRDPGVYAKVQWFDVSTDKSVENDIEVLKNNMPKAVIMYDTPEYAYVAHESAFRKDGGVSGTRKMREFLYNFVYEQGYIHYGTYKSGNNAIQLWILGGNEQTISVFAGGDGSRDNPYLIDDESQLITFAKMVNDGRSFEGQYILLNDDITISSSSLWNEIGTSEAPFKGNFDCDGKVIYTEDPSIKIFGSVTGKVSNLIVKSANN